MGARSNARRLKRANRAGRKIRSGSLRRLHCVLVRGFRIETGEEVGNFECRIKIDGEWLTPKTAKKRLRIMGADVIIRENVWER